MSETPEQNSADSASPATEGSDVDRSVRHIYCSFCGRAQDEVRLMITQACANAICDKCVALCLEVLIDHGVLEHVAYMFKVQDETGATPELREFAAIDFHEAPGQTVLSKQPLFMVPNAELRGRPLADGPA